MNRNLMSLALALVAMGLLSLPLSADTCAPGSFDSLLGSTCTIGNLQFSFNGSYNTATFANGALTDGPAASQLLFTPTALGNGGSFTLTNSNGPLSNSSTSGIETGEVVYFYYTVSTLDTMTTLVRVGANADVTTDPGSDIIYSFGTASSYNQLCSFDCSAASSGEQSYMFFGTQYIFPTNSHYDLSFFPAYSGSAYSQILLDNYNSGSSSLSSATFSFETGPYPPPPVRGTVPEPASLVLLGTGLLGAASTIRRRYMK